MSDRATVTAGAPQRAPGRATPPAKTGLHLVGAQNRRSRSRQVRFALILVVMFTALLASAVFHGVLVAGQQRLDRMDQRLEQRQQELSRAQLRVAQLTSPARLVAAARQRGMVVPKETKWLAAKAPAPVPPDTSVAGSPSPPPAGPELATGTRPAAPAAQPRGSGHGR